MPKAKAAKQSKPGLRPFMKKAPKNSQPKKENKTYTFVGFYDRLKSIDVKHSHASLVDQSYFLDTVQADLESDLNQSNFIAFL